MIFPNVAPPEVANHHLNNIRAKFKEHETEVHEKHQKLWGGLREEERATLCKAAGLKRQHVNMSLNNMEVREKSLILAAIKNMERVASLFSNVKANEWRS